MTFLSFEFVKWNDVQCLCARVGSYGIKVRIFTRSRHRARENLVQQYFCVTRHSCSRVILRTRNIERRGGCKIRSKIELDGVQVDNGGFNHAFSAAHSGNPTDRERKFGLPEAWAHEVCRERDFPRLKTRLSERGSRQSPCTRVIRHPVHRDI